MPRLEKQAQQMRTDVGSPVPITSPSNAREAGDTLARAGRNIQDFAQVLGKVQKAAAEDQHRITLANLKEEGIAAANQAYYKSQKEFESPDGSDQFKVYEESFDERVKGLLDGISNPDFKAEAQAIFAGAKNAQADNVLRSSIQKSVEFLSEGDRAAYGKAASNVHSNPFDVKRAIVENGQRLDSMGTLYAPNIKAEMKQKDGKNLAMTALGSLMQQGKFSAARKLLKDDLADVMGSDFGKTMDGIDNEQDRYEDRALSRSHQYQAHAKDAMNERREEKIGAYFNAVSFAKDPELQESIRNEMLQDRDLKPGDINLIEKQATESENRFTGNSAIGNYMARISLGETQGVTDSVLKDMQAGNITTRDGAMVMKMASFRRSQLKQNNPAFEQELKTSESRLMNYADSVSEAAALPSETVASSRNKKAYLVFDFYEEVGRGTKPAAAAQKVLNNQVNRDLHNEENYIPSFVLPYYEQNTFKDLKASQPAVNAKYLELKNAGKTVEALQVLQRYKKRLNILQNHEQGKQK